MKRACFMWSSWSAKHYCNTSRHLKEVIQQK
jgi:hypothetical protein